MPTFLLTANNPFPGFRCHACLSFPPAALRRA
jgi:hypothetical protein